MINSQKKFQIFVSSTYNDLKEERKAVIYTLLTIDAIPSGMELFPASDNDSWSLIKRVIDDCDYYVVIIGGRYGSIHEKNGISYTEMEYRYALEKKKPIFGFVHRNPGKIIADKTEKTEDSRQKLANFINLVKEKAIKEWDNPDELGKVVLQSLVFAMKFQPAIGWVKSDLLPDEDTKTEIIRLQKENNKLQKEVEKLKIKQESNLVNLSQKQDRFPIEYIISSDRVFSLDDDVKEINKEGAIILTWDIIFLIISKNLLKGDLFSSTEMGITKRIEETIFETLKDKKLLPADFITLDYFKIKNETINAIRSQFRALGIINTKYDGDGYTWKATKKGEKMALKIRTFSKNAADEIITELQNKENFDFFEFGS